jgi:nucleoside-diphosphate-sugar epimerase
MKILILGGTRFFGYHIAHRLIADGHEVTLFNRGKTADDFGDRVQRIRGDRYDHDQFYEQLRHRTFDVVVDMLAFKAEDSQAAVRAFEGNIGHFIHISTGSVYVVTKNFPCPLREEDFNRELCPPPKKDAEMWLYGYHKRRCEEVLREAFQKNAFPAMILRLPIVMGERDHTLRAYSYFLRIGDGSPVILPDGGMNVFTHIYQGDIVKTVASNLMNKASFGQAYNLAMDEVMSLRSFVLRSAEILGRKPVITDIPWQVLEEAGLGTSFSPFSTRRPFVLSTEKARRNLNYSSTPVETWLDKTISWFVDDYKGGAPENYFARKKEVAFAHKYREAVRSLKSD